MEGSANEVFFDSRSCRIMRNALRFCGRKTVPADLPSGPGKSEGKCRARCRRSERQTAMAENDSDILCCTGDERYPPSF